MTKKKKKKRKEERGEEGDEENKGGGGGAKKKKSERKKTEKEQKEGATKTTPVPTPTPTKKGEITTDPTEEKKKPKKQETKEKKKKGDASKETKTEEEAVLAAQEKKKKLNKKNYDKKKRRKQAEKVAAKKEAEKKISKEKKDYIRRDRDDDDDDDDDDDRDVSEEETSEEEEEEEYDEKKEEKNEDDDGNDDDYKKDKETQEANHRFLFSIAQSVNWLDDVDTKVQFVIAKIRNHFQPAEEDNRKMKMALQHPEKYAAVIYEDILNARLLSSPVDPLPTNKEWRQMWLNIPPWRMIGDQEVTLIVRTAKPMPKTPTPRKAKPKTKPKPKTTTTTTTNQKITCSTWLRPSRTTLFVIEWHRERCIVHEQTKEEEEEEENRIKEGKEPLLKRPNVRDDTRTGVVEDTGRIDIRKYKTAFQLLLIQWKFMMFSVSLRIHQLTHELENATDASVSNLLWSIVEYTLQSEGILPPANEQSVYLYAMQFLPLQLQTFTILAQKLSNSLPVTLIRQAVRDATIQVLNVVPELQFHSQNVAASLFDVFSVFFRFYVYQVKMKKMYM